MTEDQIRLINSNLYPCSAQEMTPEHLRLKARFLMNQKQPQAALEAQREAELMETIQEEAIYRLFGNAPDGKYERLLTLDSGDGPHTLYVDRAATQRIIMFALGRAFMAARSNIEAALIDALQDLMEFQNGPPLITWADKWNAAMEKARAAIAKAEGRG